MKIYLSFVKSYNRLYKNFEVETIVFACQFVQTLNTNVQTSLDTNVQLRVCFSSVIHAV